MDWIIVRAAVRKDDPATGPITRIKQVDIAAALVDQVDDSTCRRSAISITN